MSYDDIEAGGGPITCQRSATGPSYSVVTSFIRMSSAWYIPMPQIIFYLIFVNVIVFY